MFETIEAQLSFPNKPTREDLSLIEQNGTELFGGKDNAYVEIKPVGDQGNNYLLIINRR